nr:GGDEF domain-containing phosphodiesterase [Psychrilyobacter piezotolerans]
MDNRDRLTTAYNRDYGLKLLSNKIKEFHTEGKSFSIGLLNIDNLRFINESRGMDVGDCLLIIVHRLLVRISRKTDTIVRVEGNKFMIILPGFRKKYQGKIYDAIEKKIVFFNQNNKKEYFLRLNYIICEYYDGSMKDFFEESIQKLKKLKKNGGMEDLVLKDEISRGIKNLEFKTFFQPKVYLEEEKVGFEALVRWFHPEKGVISPNIFIPLAEESYLINKITEIVLNDSLNAAEILKTDISINLSAISFENNYFLSSLQKKIDDSRNKNYITFELTERIAVTNFEDTLDKINNFKKSGVSFSIDDFGSGYSSLSYIEKLPINELKIDKSFIDNINTSLVNPIIIELITKIGRVAGFKTVCEGVETEEQIEKLISLGSDSFQGYYFGKPEPLLRVVEKYEKGEYHSKLRQFSYKNQPEK